MFNRRPKRFPLGIATTNPTVHIGASESALPAQRLYPADKTASQMGPIKGRVAA